MSTRKYVTPALLCKPVAMWSAGITSGRAMLNSWECAACKPLLCPSCVCHRICCICSSQPEALFVASYLSIVQFMSVSNTPYLSTVKLMSVPHMLYSSSRFVCSRSDSIISSTVD